jgi:hypothetical protein
MWFKKQKDVGGARLRRHFQPARLESLAVVERRFPHRVRADLQRAADQLIGSEFKLHDFTGVRGEHQMSEPSIADLISQSRYSHVRLSPPEYEEIDIGEASPVRCIKSGLWLLSSGSEKLAVLMTPALRYGQEVGMQVQIATPNTPAGAQMAEKVFRLLEKAVNEARSYRGKILSLEQNERYTGESSGIRVHRLHAVSREQVILPASTVELLERNIVRFVENRPRLRERGQATKKGLLFYGPPGTGKSHTIHYLAGALPGHTMLIITAEQVGLLNEYMALARLLQPSVVVIEDVDLVARDRTRMESVCEEVLLNKLLNEMDGLRESADIVFVLTTNRPEQLEPALASRPGRIDQAIEFPLPDAPGRAKLIRLYAPGASLDDELVEQIVARTEQVSAAFIKELMRRAIQFQIERNGGSRLAMQDINLALEEMLFSGGSLNVKLLGGKVQSHSGEPSS